MTGILFLRKSLVTNKRCVKGGIQYGSDKTRSPLVHLKKAGLFHSLKGADLQAFQAKNQVAKKSDWARKWRSHLNLLVEVVAFLFPNQANF